MKKNALFLTVLALLMSAITPNIAKAQQQGFTPEVLLSLYRIGGAQFSPDGKAYLYTRTLPSLENNNSNTEICLGDITAPGKARVLVGSKGHSPVFLDENTIAYLSSESGKSQICLVTLDGTRRTLSSFDFDVQGFLFSPDRSKVAVIRDIPLPSIVRNDNPDLPKATGIVFEDLMYKHWDEWVVSVPQPFIASVSADLTVSTEVTPVLGKDEWYEAPTKPFGGVDQYAWSNDGKDFAYSCRKKVGLAYALSTNTDIYVYNLETKETRNITEGMMGYDTDPAYSPDGKYITWISMERDGYEADLKRLFVMDLKTGEKINLTAQYEYYVDHYEWTKDGKNIRFITNDMGLSNVFELNVASRKVSPVTKYDDADVIGFSGDGKTILYTVQSMRYPAEIHALQLKKTRKSNGIDTRLTVENDSKLKDIPNITVQKRWITTTDNKKMLTWVVLPPNFDESKKYPAILYCQGGPQSTVSQFWSYRWNFRTFASYGFIIVAPNRRGVPGFGREWNEQISGDYGGQNMKDYFKAIDTVKAEPYVDEDHLGAMGASYGGFSVYWLAGHHEGRFKALFAHAGIFNLESQYLETEEKFFANWDMGGPYWDKSNKIAQNTFANSPHRFVDKWTAPILISHGEKDYRILASQGLMAFDAAKMRGIPARMLLYPDENHWILRPQNGALFYREFNHWMSKWLKPNK